jgi:hypothetical protein
MMIFKKAIPRRTFLRGAGATLALPLLDGMVPAFAATGDTAAKPAVRLGFVYVPNGIIMEKWTPATEGTNFEITPILEPLAPFRDQFVVVSGLDNKAAQPPPGERRAGPHASASGAFLTGVYPKPPAQAGISVDQIAAAELGKHTQLASLELTLDSGEQGAGADAADTDAYLNTMSWRTATTPLPVENNPRRLFQRMFGEDGSTSAEERLRRIQEDRSILDSVTEELGRLVRRIGPSDSAKLNEYLEGVRDIERRINKAAEGSSQELLVMERPAGIPAVYDEHAKLMFDLQVLAYQTDMTRVTTLLMAREKSERAYREIGLEEGHHALSHHDGNPEMIEKVSRINTYHAKLFAHFLEKLRTTPDGDGSLLDHSIIMYASSMSDGSSHKPLNVPILIAGGGAGQIKGGRHLRHPKSPPVTNLFLTLLDMTGVPVESFADSTGKLELLSVA